MNSTRSSYSCILSQLNKRVARLSSSRFSSAANTNGFQFKTKEELIKNPPRTVFDRKVPERKLYLIQGYYERLESPLVMVYQHNNLSVPEYRALQAQVLKLGARVQIARTGVLRAALKDSPYEAMQALFRGPTLMIYAGEPGTTEVNTLAKKIHASLEKNRKLLFIGAKTDDMLFSEATFKPFMELPSLDILRSQLVGTLQANPSRLISLLSQEPQLLTRLLTQHKDNLEGK